MVRVYHCCRNNSPLTTVNSTGLCMNYHEPTIQQPLGHFRADIGAGTMVVHPPQIPLATETPWRGWRGALASLTSKGRFVGHRTHQCHRLALIVGLMAVLWDSVAPAVEVNC